MNRDIKKVIFKGVGLAMGIATLVLNIIKTLEVKTAISFLSIGIICLAIEGLENR